MPSEFSVPLTALTLGVGPDQLSDWMIKPKELRFTATQVAASATTPLVLVQNSDTTKFLLFHGLVAYIIGGTTNYDQNQNFIVKYQTAGGGGTVSTTLANLMNGGAVGTMKTCKPITTDIAPEAGQDLVLTSSASPYSAAGDRELYVVVYSSLNNVPT